MSAFDYVRTHYNVPAEIGRRITMSGRPGIIVEDRGNYIGVNFDADKPNVVKKCHPTWEVVYLGIGEPRKMTKAQARYREFLDADSGLTFVEHLKWRHANRERIAALST